MAAEDDSKEEQTMPGRSAGNAEESQPFVVIGENVHTTRVVRRPGPLVKPDEDGREDRGLMKVQAHEIAGLCRSQSHEFLTLMKITDS